MSKRWLRYGIVGNFLSYGLGVGFMLYLGTPFFTKVGSSTTSDRITAPKWMRNWPRKYSLSQTLN